MLSTEETENNNVGTGISSNQQNWELVAEGDWLVGQRFKINGHAVLGRDSSCDITIPGTHLSRRHAELAIKGTKLLIRDLNSSNGTYVNDKKVTETELKPGDTIRFDVLMFRIHGPKIEKADVNATMIRQMPPQHKKAKAPSPRPSPEAKNWKTKPTSVGNRDETTQMSSVQKATQSLTTLVAIVFGIATIAALAYLITQL